MMCLYPVIIRNKKFQMNEKNGGIIPPVRDKRTLYIEAGCGKCIECMKKKSREWQTRLLEEIKENTDGVFVTLTFSDESLEELSKETKLEDENLKYNEIVRIAVRKFLERWRKKHKKSVRHWLVTERGQKATERIHLHGLLFTNVKEDIQILWKYGNVYLGEYVNEGTINYIVKYLHKTDVKHPEYQPKMFVSAGIGKNYLESQEAKRHKFKNEETREYYRTKTGTKTNMPAYYRRKLWTDEEREQLWINNMNKKITYVMGEKVDISENEEEAEKLRKWYRKLNTELGYRDGRKKIEEQIDKNEKTKKRLREKK